MNQRNIFQVILFYSMALCVLSMVLDWYEYKIFDEGYNVISVWSYNPFFGWYSNNPVMDFKPRGGIFFSLLNYTVIFLIVIIIYLEFVDSYSEERTNLILKSRLGILIFITSIEIIQISVFIFYNFLVNGLFFPILVKFEIILSQISFYSIHPGLMLKLINIVLELTIIRIYFQSLGNLSLLFFKQSPLEVYK